MKSLQCLIFKRKFPPGCLILKTKTHCTKQYRYMMMFHYISNSQYLTSGVVIWSKWKALNFKAFTKLQHEIRLFCVCVCNCFFSGFSACLLFLMFFFNKIHLTKHSPIYRHCFYSLWGFNCSYIKKINHAPPSMNAWTMVDNYIFTISPFY